jgi:PAS domain S-box-containing protein
MTMERLFDVPGEMALRMRTLDWAATPLGPVSDWSPALRTTVGLLLRSRFPMLLWWGPQFVQLYNDAYVPIPGAKHPRALGQMGSECWVEIWHIIGPMAQAPYSGGPATASDDLFVLMDRRGFLEETHFIISYSPVPDESVAATGIGGVLATVTETTEQVVGERQLRTLRELGARAPEAKTAEQACTIAATTLAQNTWDVPFALIYLLDPDAKRLRLVCTSGFDGAQGSANPPEISLEDLECAPWQLRGVVEERRIEIFDDLRARFETLPCGRWTESPRAAIAFPLATPDQAQVYGILIAGVSPHRALDDGYRGFFELATGQVVTAIRNARAYEEERIRAERLAEIDRAKTVFFSNVSHEFRTPLTLMLGPVEDALADLEHPLAPLQRERQELVHRSALRLQKLVNSLLDFARIEAGRVEASFQPTDLAALTAGLASSFRSAVERGGLRLDVDCPPLSGPVHVDAEMWEKIVLNLLSNAFKFTFEGAIAVRLRAQGNDIELQVSDTGVGIPPHELPRLFERFHRVAETPARTHEGSGIGLALAQDLVKLHGGTIRVESQQGRGSTFTVTIPAGTRHLPPDRIGAPRALSSSSIRAEAYVAEALRWLPGEGQSEAASDLDEEFSAPASTLQGARILVADDNADMRHYVARLLRSHWTVETVADGTEALRSVHAGRPDLILADVMMPGMNGFELLQAVRKDAATADIPVLMLSARAGEESRIEGLDAGADDYLVKPFSARELVARVASQLALARLRSESARERNLLLERERAARKEAELQRERLVSLFTQAPTPIVILRGPDHVIELANASACRVWGRTQEQVIRRPLFDALPELRGQVFQELLDHVLKTGTPYIGKETLARVKRRDEGPLDDVFFNFVYDPLRSVTGEVEGVLVIAFDVTDEVLARQEMEKLRSEAEHASRAKDEFLAMLGHELRNPLAPIRTALQLLRMRGHQLTELALIERQVGHLVRLVDDLLDVSRITRGNVELRKEPVELAAVVVRGLETASPLLEQRRQRVDLDIPAEGAAIEADPQRLAQVVANLLTNASKHSDPGARIQVTGSREHDLVRLRVRDAGAGISPEMLERIFEMFVQETQPLDRSKGGLGLGLAIVRSLIELHGGSVRALSDGPGRGSEFIVDLPALAETREASSMAAVDILTRKSGSTTYGRRVLVVDDNEDALWALATVLEDLGYAVATAHDGPGALKAAERFRPEIALLDIGLPVMDGYELARQLTDAAPAEEAPYLIAITGYGQDADRARSTAAGFRAHLVKPVELTDLEHVLAAVHAHLDAPSEESTRP